MEEIAPGIWHWTAPHPHIGVDVSSYYLAEPRVLLDPLTPDDVVERLDELGPPREILLTCRHHWRDCSKLTERFGVTVRASRPGMHEFSGDQPVEPFDFGDELAPGRGGGPRGGLDLARRDSVLLERPLQHRAD